MLFHTTQFGTRDKKVSKKPIDLYEMEEKACIFQEILSNL